VLFYLHVFIDRVHGIRRDKGSDVDGFLVLRAKLVQLIGIDNHLLILRVLEPRDDLVVRYFAVDWAGLLVLNAAVALGMELVEVDFAATADEGRVGSDGHGYKTQPDETTPVRA
jgi:hypothetical protein